MKSRAFLILFLFLGSCLYAQQRVISLNKDIYPDKGNQSFTIRAPDGGEFRAVSLRITPIERNGWKFKEIKRAGSWRGNNPFTYSLTPADGRIGLFQVIFTRTGGGRGQGGSNEVVVDVEINKSSTLDKFFITPREEYILCNGDSVTFKSWFAPTRSTRERRRAKWEVNDHKISSQIDLAQGLSYL